MIRSKQDKERIQERIQKAARTRVAAKKPHPCRIHNWDLIESLYMAGMDVAELLKIPECENLSEAYLRKMISTRGWPEKRKGLQKVFNAQTAMTIQDRMQSAMEEHYRFMLKEIDDERAIYAKRIKSTNIKDQAERIDLLIKLEGVVRKTLGLDDMTPADRNKNSFNQMIVIHNNGPDLQGDQVRSATLPLLSNKNVTTGRITQKNGIQEEGQKTETSEGQDECAGQDQRGRELSPAILTPIVRTPEEILKCFRMEKVGEG